MFNKSLFTSLVAAITGMGASLQLAGMHFKAPKKPAKRYPSMVVSSPATIAAWNAKVEAGKISPKGHRHA